MNIVEAAKSGKSFRRPGEIIYLLTQMNRRRMLDLCYEDIIANDWEIVEEKITITKATLAAGILRYVSRSLGLNHISIDDLWGFLKENK